MTIAFSSTPTGIIVYQRADLTYEWSGQYKRKIIKKAIPTEDGKRCILLLDPDASNSSVFENLLCIDQSGNLIWIAKLTSVPDAFLEVALTSGVLSATTWSGFRILLDQNTGIELKRFFEK